MTPLPPHLSTALLCALSSCLLCTPSTAQDTSTPCQPTHPNPNGAWLETPCPHTPTPPTQHLVDVYILAGQSNMNGHGLTRDLPQDLRTPHPTALIYTGSPGHWKPLQPSSTLPARFGPEVSFGFAMAQDTPRRIAIIKVAAHWTSLHSDWNPPNGWLFRTLKKTTKLALADLRAQNLTPRIAGFVWMQGETDAAGKHTTAHAYGDHLRTFLHAVRQTFNAPQLPCVVGAIAGSKLKWRDTVRDGQKKTTRDDNHAFFVETNDLTMWPDALHWSSSGNVRLGMRFAAVLRARRLRSLASRP